MVGAAANDTVASRAQEVGPQTSACSGPALVIFLSVFALDGFVRRRHVLFPDDCRRCAADISNRRAVARARVPAPEHAVFARSSEPSRAGHPVEGVGRTQISVENLTGASGLRRVADCRYCSVASSQRSGDRQSRERRSSRSKRNSFGMRSRNRSNNSSCDRTSAAAASRPTLISS